MGQGVRYPDGCGPEASCHLTNKVEGVIVGPPFFFYVKKYVVNILSYLNSSIMTIYICVSNTQNICFWPQTLLLKPEKHSGLLFLDVSLV